MRFFLLCFLTACLMFMSISCSTLAPQADPRLNAPQEFTYDVTISLNGFKARATFERSVRGEYTLCYQEPQNIAGLTYGWIAGEVTRGLYDLGEVAEYWPDDIISLLAEACKAYYNVDDLTMTINRKEESVQFVHKDFTIMASPESGQILEISFPNENLFVQMKAESE